ncbi:TetR/AcrR family transcriptional regulator [Siminovitchia sp. FSL H7-0308]|uniref:TetR/AcrR family transcriptional regulator n=1 Tax=Siminovitchia sp. FSL H7-0308 TaxID=2921432 RepID=UPI0030ECD97B
MAKKFTEEEKRFIRQKLLTEGKRLFEVHGLQKTSIGELTKKAGIAQGTFYQFFSSKEELYFDIIEQEEQAIQRELVDQIATARLTKSSFVHFLQQAIYSLEKSPILHQLHDEHTMALLMRKLPEEKLAMNHQRDADFLLPLIERWQTEGQMQKLPPNVIIGMIRALVLLALQKNAIGEDVYEEAMAQFIQMMADSLVLEEDTQ